MISHIELYFRHLRPANLQNLAAVNIIVGPNNAGKTSLLRGIRGDLAVEGNRLRLGTSLVGRTDLTGIFKTLGPGFTTFWTEESAHRNPEWYFSGEGKHDTRFGSRGIEVRPKPSGAWQGDSIPARNEAFLTEQAMLKEQHRIFRNYAYFLWHRRKSLYSELLGPHYGRLDDEAEHVAARLDELLTGPMREKLGSAIEQFVNYVIPGLGAVSIRRTKSDGENARISVVFGNGDNERTLEELGGGVEQVLTLALVLIGEKDEASAVYIEEPETHLHEAAQRRLIEQIERHRGARMIFIATHSPTLVNGYAGANVYRITRRPDGNAEIQKCIGRPHQRQILDDLGVLPSSLTQTNCVVWVEGPTETYLVRHWLSIVDPELKLHQHYEFAETGGSNIVHLGANLDSDDLENLKDIMQVCRSNFVVCDRDAGVGSDASKASVQNIKALVGENYWITRGYEVEWYYTSEVVKAIWSEAVADHIAKRTEADVPFYGCLAESGAHGTKSAADRKVAYAKRAVQLAPQQADWFGGTMGSDLFDNIARLAKFIRQANQMTESSAETCPACNRPIDASTQA